VSQYQPAPAGEIEVEIVAASIGEVSWKVNDANPTGECLRLRLSAGRAYAFVFADVPANWRGSMQAISAAVGIAVEQLRPEVLIGRRARVLLKHYVARDGSTRATVARWLPVTAAEGVAQAVTPAAPETQPAIQTVQVQARPSRNAPPQFGSIDDFPF